MRLLFVDDDLDNVAFVAEALRAGLGFEVVVVTTVEAAVAALRAGPVDLLVLDLFIPLGARPEQLWGPRARRFADSIEHLGGLLLLDELDRVSHRPATLLHTACLDPVLLELARAHVRERVRKPAPPEVLLAAVRRALE